VYFSGSDSTEHVISDHIKLPSYGDVFDMNGDGKPDIVVAGEQLSWLENPNWVEHRLAPACSSDVRWFEVKVADLNGDGRPDFVASVRPRSGIEGGAVVMGLNEGDHFVLYTLISGWGSANAIRIADVDGDGKLDVIASTDRPFNEVRLWRAPGYRVTASH
jgi:hypothetical protein